MALCQRCYKTPPIYDCFICKGYFCLSCDEYIHSFPSKKLHTRRMLDISNTINNKQNQENKLKIIQENYQKEAEISKNLLPPEPNESNPDVCTIILRYPDGVKTMERRFLKTDKINALFYFVKSKGREIFSEREYNDFELIFGFPPKNLGNSKEKTLEEEGMFPNGIINIKEKS